MAYVLKMVRGTMGGSEEAYTLTQDGKQTVKGKPFPDLDMDKFWKEMGPTIDSVVAVCGEG
jgi:hypothetical protein